MIGLPYWNFLKNSLFVTLTSVVASTLIALLAAIAVARFRFRVPHLVPDHAADRADAAAAGAGDRAVPRLPLARAAGQPGRADPLHGVLAAGHDLDAAQLRGSGIREMEDKDIDGAGPMRIFWRIMLPLVAPGLVATSVFAFIFAWNEFIFALTFLGTDYAKYTLPIYVTYFYGRGTVDWGSIMAASTLFTIPVMAFFLIVQRRMNGLVSGAVKG